MASNAWKGGRIVTDRGYVKIWCPQHPMANATGYAYEHRVAVYDDGRDPTGLQVHHIDGDKLNNEPSNLEVMSRADHYALHREVGRPVGNQYGVFIVLTAEERREKDRARCRENARKRRAAARAAGVYQ